MDSGRNAVKPLSGVMVVEFGTSVAAPYAGLILADLGARVVKIENPEGGDYARGWGPPFWQGTASAFHALNRGKESLAVDLGNPESAAALRRLIVDEADIVIQNLRHGVLSRFGLGRDEFRSAKPSLIWCDIGAFGADGPLAEKPGYDPLMQASSGIMSVTGHGAEDPVRVGVSLVDMGSGMWAVIGILTALLGREKSGAGTAVATSLYETGIAWMMIPLAGYAATGDVRKPYGSGVGEIVPYQAFRTASGWLMIAAGNDNLFRRLCEALGLPGLPEDPLYRTNADRVVNRITLLRTIAEVVATRNLEDLARHLDSVGVPNAPIHKVDQVFHAPQTTALSLIAAGETDTLALASIPITLDGLRPRTPRRAPQLGEDDAQLYGRRVRAK